MGADKVDVEGGGLFHLFDRKRNARKKFISHEESSPEAAQLGKKFYNSQPNELSLFDEEENIGASSSRGSEYSGHSSVYNEERNGTRAPGLVAKLMGLDSMPASVVSESYSAPLNDLQTLQNDHRIVRSPEFYTNNRFNRISKRAGGYCRRQEESRSKNVPISHTERSRVEALPQKSARSRHSTNQKLSSTYNPGITSLPNGVHIIEATTNTNQPECKTSTRGKIQSFRPSSTPLKVCDSKETMMASERVPKFPESPRRIKESTSRRSLRGESLNRSCNSMKDTGFSGPPSGMGGTNLVDVEVKGKSTTRAVQEKVNAQRRKISDTRSKSTLTQKDLGQCKWNQPFKSQNQESKHQKKSSATNASGVLRKNNQKQNCKTNQDNFATKPSDCKTDVPSGKNKTVHNKLSRNSKLGYRKELSGTADLQKEGPSPSRKNLSLNKTVIEGSIYHKKERSIDNIIVGSRHEKHIQRIGSDSTDIVSFTFTSSMVKSTSKSQFFSEVDKSVKRNAHYIDTQTGRMALDAISENLSSPGFSELTDDTLGYFVEQKLRKLISGIESPHSHLSKAGRMATSLSIMQVPPSDFDIPATAPAEVENEEGFKSVKHELGGFLHHDLSPSSGQALGISQKQPEVERLDCNSCDWQKKIDHHLESPLSVLETSSSNEYCNSSISWESTDGDKLCSSFQAHPIISVNFSNKIPSTETELELSDLACSAFTETLNEERALEISRTVPTDACTMKLEYLREMLDNIFSTFKDLGSCQIVHALKTLDPILFEELECRKSLVTHERENLDCRLRRKILFDCMKDCFDKKYNCYFQAGYTAWTKGTAFVGTVMLDEVCKEILEWKSMGEWMVDKLIDKDMSCHLGRWINFEIEAFEAGVEIESGIFSSLVDEVAADFLIHDHTV